MGYKIQRFGNLWKKVLSTLYCQAVKAIKFQNQLNRKIIETGKINTHNKHMHDLSLSWLGTGTSVKVEGLD